MAFLNLLQGSFTGRLGELTGARWKGIPTVRSAVFSKAPPTAQQTANVRAFEKLNRIGSAIARMGFAHTGLSAKGIHPHNAVARWLKPAIRGGVFNPANIEEVIPATKDIVLGGFTLDFLTGVFNINILPYARYIPPHGSKLFVLVFDDNGQVIWSKLSDTFNLQVRFQQPIFDIPVFSIMAFTSIQSDKGLVIKNFIYKRGTGMRYSLDEQPTGDLWLDGRPIYVRSFTIPWEDVGNYGTSEVSWSIPGLGTIIDYKALTQTLPPNIRTWAGTVPLLQYISPNVNFNMIECYTFPDNDDLCFNFSAYTSNMYTNFKNSNVTLTAWYTKRSDQPMP